MPYADKDYYVNTHQGNIKDDSIERALNAASRHIDTLTYNRIVGRGINALTEFQRDIIREVCCRLADFEYANSDMINTVLQSYSLNGVSMTFGEGWNMVCRQGVAIPRDLYELLCQTGLCTTRLG